MCMRNGNDGSQIFPINNWKQQQSFINSDVDSIEWPALPDDGWVQFRRVKEHDTEDATHSKLASNSQSSGDLGQVNPRLYKNK